MFLAEFAITDLYFRIESTTHAFKRMKERGIEENLVIDLIQDLDSKVLGYNNSGEEIAIINQEHDIAVIIEVRLNKVVIITVIDRANIHIKDGTMLEEIA